MAQDKRVEQITDMEVDFAQWYTDICRKAELVEYASVKGFTILRPYGYAIWENMQKTIPENEKTYPDPWMFSHNPKDPANAFSLPYRALMLRHVNDVRMDNVKFSFNAEDTRTDFFIEDATNVRATEILVQGTDRSKAFSE